MTNKNKLFLTASQAIAATISRLNVGVVSAYPITPQTKIVEELANLEAKKIGTYEFVRAESEFAAASIALGAAASGVRAYTATSSQGLLFMLEVLYNIAGLRLPMVMTCANRALSAPLNIWNDHQDAMAARDAGWIMLFAANHDEAVKMHIIGYAIAEAAKLPVMINVDGFVLTHASEGVYIPSRAAIKKLTPDYKPADNTYLDTKNPITMGHLVTPADYTGFRKNIQTDLTNSAALINKFSANYNKYFNLKNKSYFDNGLVEYYGPKNAEQVIISLGATTGTVMAAVDEFNKTNKNKAAVIKLKALRPMPAADLIKLTKNKIIIILNRALSPGSLPPLSADIAAILPNKNLCHAVIGLGGRDIKTDMIIKLLKSKLTSQLIFI